MPTLSSARLGRGRAQVLTCVAALALGCLFWGTSFRAARGYFPAPLDDVYIHFDFARSLARGHPFEWIAGQGYSSGETSPLYAAVLAVGWLLGFHGKAMGIWAALVAVVATASIVRSTRRLIDLPRGALAWLVALLPLSMAIVDWTLFSGMEMAVFCAVLVRSLVLLRETRAPRFAARCTREQAQWKLGGLGAALCLLRPEAALLVGIFAVFAARGASVRSGLAAFLRATAPGAAATLFILALNRVFTGSPQSAGAELKLLSSNPYLSDPDRARTFLENLVTFFVKVLRSELPGGPVFFGWIPALAALGLLSRRHRTVTAACLLGAVGWVLLVSWNGNSPFHNFRYYAPALVLLLVASALGVASLARFGRGDVLVFALTLLTLGGSVGRFPEQMRHFRRSVANIRDQQIEAGERLAARVSPEERVLLGDAGAIPFISERGAIDALGLGGFDRVPFARAAVHGEAATVELLERLPPHERPTYLALYPNWFGAITSRFGQEVDRVTITDNLICGGTSKVIYRADWSALIQDAEAATLPGASILDELDVADVLSERDHAYSAPLPKGGFTTMEILDDGTGRRFDGGRIVPEGMRESFVVRRAPEGGVARIVVRGDATAGDMIVHANGRTALLRWEPARDGRWRHGETTLAGLRAGDTIAFEAIHAYRNYHVWIAEAAVAERR